MTGLETGLLAQVGKNLMENSSGAVKAKFKAKWQSFNWWTAQLRYREKIESDYGWTRVLGKAEPIKLRGIYTDVYLLDKPTAFLRFDIEKLRADPTRIADQQKRLGGIELVNSDRSSKLYILGKPGAGKTTFLRYLALQASLGNIQKIPVFVSLKEWADSGLGLMPFIVKQFDICSFPDSAFLVEYILETGQSLVLFDGLDETQQEGGKRDQIIDEIRDFSRKYDENQIIITCRIAASDYSFERFTYLEVADFNSSQIDIFVDNWFDTEGSVLFKREFAKPENDSLREMATTPLLLSLLCLNFEETFNFPSRRVEIYEDALSALLHKWDASRRIKRDEVYKGLSLGRKKQLFARVAAQTFEKNEYFVAKPRVSNLIVEYLRQLPGAAQVEDIDGENVLDAIEAQHSVIIERAKGIHSFSHLTFQEYFTARYIIENAGEGTITKLLHPANITDDRWREVVLVVASLLDDASMFFCAFQESIRGLIEGDDALEELFRWIERKAVKLDNIPREVSRLLYLYLAYAKDSDSYSYSEEGSGKRSPAKRAAPDIPTAFYLISKSIAARKQVEVRSRAIARNGALEDVFSIDAGPNFALDAGLIYLRWHFRPGAFFEEKWTVRHGTVVDVADRKPSMGFLTKISAYWRHFGLMAEADILDEFSSRFQSVTSKPAVEGVINEFVNWLNPKLKGRRLRSKELTWDQNARLDAILRAIHLLFDSLDLATVPNRNEIRSDVLKIEQAIRTSSA